MNTILSMSPDGPTRHVSTKPGEVHFPRGWDQLCVGAADRHLDVLGQEELVPHVVPGSRGGKRDPAGLAESVDPPVLRRTPAGPTDGDVELVLAGRPIYLDASAIADFGALASTELREGQATEAWAKPVDGRLTNTLGGSGLAGGLLRIGAAATAGAECDGRGSEHREC